jgi:hypothetical protein
MSFVYFTLINKACDCPTLSFTCLDFLKCFFEKTTLQMTAPSPSKQYDNKMIHLLKNLNKNAKVIKATDQCLLNVYINI